VLQQRRHRGDLRVIKQVRASADEAELINTAFGGSKKGTKVSATQTVSDP